MTIDRYYFKARLLPTVLTAIPAIYFYHALIAPLFHENLNKIFSTLPTITTATFSAAIVFLLIGINRLCSKEIFQKFYFQDDASMPTTNYLLWNDTQCEKEIKRKIRTKIKDKFDITLLSPEDETTEEVAARKKIAAAVSQIRNSLRGNMMLARHNEDYGFFRNMAGGCLIAIIFSVLILILAFAYQNQQQKSIALAFIIGYGLLLVIGLIAIKRYGFYYSKILYEQFLSLK
jgi:uncharacterized integral membrane protein